MSPISMGILLVVALFAVGLVATYFVAVAATAHVETNPPRRRFADRVRVWMSNIGVVDSPIDLEDSYGEAFSMPESGGM